MSWQRVPNIITQFEKKLASRVEQQ